MFFFLLRRNLFILRIFIYNYVTIDVFSLACIQKCPEVFKSLNICSAEIVSMPKVAEDFSDDRQRSERSSSRNFFRFCGRYLLVKLIKLTPNWILQICLCSKFLEQLFLIDTSACRDMKFSKFRIEVLDIYEF